VAHLFRRAHANNQSQIVYAISIRGMTCACYASNRAAARSWRRRAISTVPNGAERAAVCRRPPVFLYYVGFHCARDVPHQQAIGLAIE